MQTLYTKFFGSLDPWTISVTSITLIATIHHVSTSAKLLQANNPWNRMANPWPLLLSASTADVQFCSTQSSRCYQSCPCGLGAFSPSLIWHRHLWNYGISSSPCTPHHLRSAACDGLHRKRRASRQPIGLCLVLLPFTADLLPLHHRLPRSLGRS